MSLWGKKVADMTSELIKDLIETIKKINYDEKKLNEILSINSSKKMYLMLLQFHSKNIKELNNKANKIIEDRWEK